MTDAAPKEEVGFEMNRSSLPPVGVSMPSGFVKNNGGVSAAAGSVESEVSPKTLTLALLVEELRELRQACENATHWWQSSLLPALITTLGAAAIATGWAVVSHQADVNLAESHRTYDRRSALKQLLDTSFEGQLSAMQTVCERDTTQSYQQLKRNWVLQPELSRLLTGGSSKKPSSISLSELNEGITQSIAVQADEKATLDRAYEKTVSGRSVSSVVAEFPIVFASPQMKASADAFIGAWNALAQETRAEVVETWRQKLRDAARELNAEANNPNSGGQLVDVEGSSLRKVQRDRELVCAQKADTVRQTYEQLAHASAAELTSLKPL